MSYVGADVDSLQRAAAQLRASADELDGHSQVLTTMLGGIDWAGDVAVRFLSSWTGAHRVNLTSTSHFFREAASTLDRNASEQASASADGAAGSLFAPHSPEAPYARHIESFEVSSTASIAVFGFEGGSGVVVTEMSDGSFRVVVTGTITGEAGAKLEKLFDTVGMDVPVDFGVEVGADAQWSLEFIADDRDAAMELRDALQGRVSSISNRVILGGTVDDSEARQTALGIAGVRVGSVTTSQGFGAGGAGELVAGVDAGVAYARGTTYHPDGTRTETHVYSGDASGSGWNMDGASYERSISTTYSPAGDLTSVEVVARDYAVSDTRGGGEKARDTALGILPGLNYSNVETSSGVVVTTSVYESSALSSEQLEFASKGEYGDFARSSSDVPHSTVTEQYTGSTDGSTRGLLGGSSTTTYGESTLVSRAVDPA